MSFSAILLGSTSGVADASRGLPLGEKNIEFWSWTQANTDTGGTFTTRMPLPEGVMGSVTSSSTNNGKTVAFSVSGTTVTVTTDNASGTASPTGGLIMVIGKGR